MKKFAVASIFAALVLGGIVIGMGSDTKTAESIPPGPYGPYSTIA